MTWTERVRFDVTCTASGATYEQYIRGGLLYAVRYTIASASAFATGATVLLSAVPAGSSGHSLMTLVNTSVAGMYYPRKETHTTGGATAGTSDVMLPISQEYLRLTVASGGASGRGIFDCYIQGSV